MIFLTLVPVMHGASVALNLASLVRAMSEPSEAAKAIYALDTDKSGKVERSEVLAFAQSQGLDASAVQNEFAVFDGNHDGTLDVAELNMTLTPSMDPILNPPEVAPQSVLMRRSESVMKPASSRGNPGLATLKALDTDGSGAAEIFEVEAFATSQGLNTAETVQEFKLMDTNGDGKIDSSEMISELKETMPASAAASTTEKPAVQVDPVLLASVAARADRTVAEAFAKKAAKDLEQRSKDMVEAGKLEQAAYSLRASAAKLTTEAGAIAEVAARKAASKVMKIAILQAQSFESQAKVASGRVEGSHQKSVLAMTGATEARNEALQGVATMADQDQKPVTLGLSLAATTSADFGA